MELAKEPNRKEIIDYLKSDIANCLYPYIDITSYGLNHPNIRVWISRSETTINSVVMRYYDSIWICSAENDSDLCELAELLAKENVSMIAGNKVLIEKLFANKALNHQYQYSSGWILKSSRNNASAEHQHEIYEASQSDAAEIAKLICADKEIGGHYTVETLTDQMRERIISRHGRSWVIKSNGKIIAHVATYAESEQAVVIGGVIVDPNYRTRGYATDLMRYVSALLIKEEKPAYQFVLHEESIQLHQKSGYVVCGEYGKMIQA